MKGFRGTLIFAVLVLAAGVFTYHEYQQSKDAPELKPNEIKVFDFDEANIQKVSIKKDKQVVTVEKNGSAWKMTAPISDDTDSYAVTSMLDRLAKSTAKDVRDKDEKKQGVDWKKYGFNPGTVVTITDKTGKSEIATISSLSAYDGSFFIRKGDDLYLGDRSWAHLEDKSETDLRSHRIFKGHQTVDSIRMVSYGKNSRHLELQKTKDGWALKPASKYPIDSEAVDNWVSQLRSLRAISFADENPSEKELKKTLLKTPRMDLKVTFKMEAGKDKDKQKNPSAAAEIKIGSGDKGQIYARSSFRPTLYVIDQGSLNNLNVSPEHFWDHKFPFHFSLEKVESMSLATKETSIEVQKKGSEWKLAKAANGETLNTQKLEQFFQKLSDLSVKEFLPEKGDYGFVGPRRGIVLKDGKGQSLFDLRVGNKTKDGRSVYVRIAGFKNIFTVAQIRLNDVLSMKLVDSSAKSSSHKSK